MGNPLFNMLGGGMPQNPMNKMLQDYKKFRQEMQGKNPQEEINKMLQSGKLNQNQLNQMQGIMCYSCLTEYGLIIARTSDMKQQAVEWYYFQDFTAWDLTQTSRQQLRAKLILKLSRTEREYLVQKLSIRLRQQGIL